MVYENYDQFEKALRDFGTRVDVIVAMEMSGKIDSETAWKEIKDNYKSLKKIRKSYSSLDAMDNIP